jgi:hypothetical protein
MTVDAPRRAADANRMRRCRHRRVGLFAALVLIALAVGFSSTAGATEAGVNVPTAIGFSSPKSIAAIRASRPAWVRVFMEWAVMEPTAGTYDPWQIHLYNKFFSELPAGTKVDVDIEDSPAWATGVAGSSTAPPTDDGTFAHFMGHITNALHDRVNAWEIWNEESSTGWWSGSIAQYAGLVKAAYPAIRAADPHALVLLGANSPEWLNALYGDGIKGYFDGDSIHTDTACNITSPYVYEYNPHTNTVNQYFFLGFTGTHTIMAAHGDGDKGIYMTEIGWSSTSTECTTGASANQKLAGVTPQTQATYLTQAYHCLAQPQYSYIKAAMWFELYNNGDSPAPLDNYGLLTTSFAAKPAFTAFEDISLHGDTQPGPCGNFSAPKIKILRPTQKHFSGPLKIAVAASSPANGVREITIYLTKHSREHFDAKKGFPKTLHAGLTWLGARHLHAGPHRIKIVVVDKLGNVATKTFEVVRARAPHKARHHAAHH